MVKMFTDGSIDYNPGGTGGYAALFISDDGYKDFIWGYVEENIDNTAHRMEVLAIIWGLKYLINEGVSDYISIYCDNEQVVKRIKEYLSVEYKERLFGKGRNSDLWDEFLSIMDDISFSIQWVRAHSGNKHNKLADKIANLARLQKNDEIEKLKREY